MRTISREATINDTSEDIFCTCCVTDRSTLDRSSHLLQNGRKWSGFQLSSFPIYFHCQRPGATKRSSCSILLLLILSETQCHQKQQQQRATTTTTTVSDLVPLKGWVIAATVGQCGATSSRWGGAVALGLWSFRRDAIYAIYVRDM